MTEKLRSGHLNLQYDRFGRPCHLWAGNVHVGRFAGIEAAPEGSLRNVGQWTIGPYRWDGAGAPSPKRMRLARPWPRPPRAVPLPF
jgi:hypothetical protein